MNSKKRKKQARLQTLEDVYAAIPSVECQGLCSEGCGVIPLFPVEERNMLEKCGKLPAPTSGMTCSALRENRCTVYENRPFVCRIWGAVERMRCPFGCKVERILTEAEVKQLMDSLSRLSNGEPWGVSVVANPVIAMMGNENSTLSGHEIMQAIGDISLSQALDSDMPKNKPSRGVKK